MSDKRKPTIEELERMLDEDDTNMEILPNGEIRTRDSTGDVAGKTPLTFRENLGGEYQSPLSFFEGLPGGQCRGCGCDDLHACGCDDGLPCYWVEEDLCSACV